MAAETINVEVHPVFRKKTRGQVIAAEFQEGFSHIGTAMTEARRAAADELAPRIAAARDAAGPALGAAQLAVAPKVAAAVAVAAPAVASAREAIGPRVEGAREALSPRVEAALGAAVPRLQAAQEAVDAGLAAAAEALSPRVHAAREAAVPALTGAVAATSAAAGRAAADLGPRVEAAQRAAQRALATEVLPKVVAAREAVGPAFEHARGTLVAGVETALDELEARRDELVGAAGRTSGKAKRRAAKATARQKAKAKAARTSAKASARAKRGTTLAPQPRRWPWLAVFAAVGAVAFAVLRRRTDPDPWTPAPTGDGPVPSYREDPVPSSPSSNDSGKTVSSATWESGDSAPAESDMGVRDAQMVDSDGPTDPVDPKNNPEPFTSGGSDDPGPTAGPAGSGMA